jgi:hypothetical protein
MSGQELCAIYVENMRLQGVETDSWSQLEGYEQQAWNDTAAEVKR